MNLAKLWLDSGTMFGPGGESFERNQEKRSFRKDGGAYEESTSLSVIRIRLRSDGSP